ncbi:MAG: hypothetical protein ACI9NC_005628 [Verrucomicrobiales bacterium]|jgi:hypothetical protein
MGLEPSSGAEIAVFLGSVEYFDLTPQPEHNHEEHASAVSSLSPKFEIDPQKFLTD